MSRGGAEDRIQVRRRIEHVEIIEALTEADELDRHAQLLLDGEEGAAPGTAVELRDHEPGERGDLVKGQRLTHRVHAGGRVDDEEYLVRSLGDEPLDDPA